MSDQDIFFPEASQHQPPPVEATTPSHQKSYAIAYLLWLCLGFIGGHRFYLGKWFTGLLYATSFGFFGVGWALDFFLIIPMVKKAREKAALHALSVPVVEEEVPLPAWTEERSFMGCLELPIQILFFLFLPALLVLIAVLLHQIEFAVMIVVLLALIGLLGSFQKTLRHYPFLDKMPAFGDAISIVTDLNKYYYENKPKFFLYYLFYPILGFLSLPFSEKSRTEFKLYLKILGSLLLLLIIDTIFSYSSLYPPHLDYTDAIFIIFLQLIMMFFVLIAFMIPMVSTSFKWNLQGRKKTSQFLTFLGLSLAVIVGVYGYMKEKEEVSIISDTLLQERFKKESFRQELAQASEMFLLYHAKQEIPENSEDVFYHKAWTEKYRRLIGTIAVDDEVNAFEVIVMKGISPGEDGWIGLRLNLRKKSLQFLCFIDSQGNFYDTWQSLPEKITSKLKEKKDEDSLVIHPWEITDKILLKDRK